MLRLFQGIETDQTPKITRYLEESTALLRAARTSPETKRWLAWALYWKGVNFSWFDRQNDEKHLVQEALDLFGQVADAHGAAECLQALGIMESDLTLARELHQEQLAVDEANGDVEGIATALLHLGWVEFDDGYYKEARLFYERCLEQYAKVKNQNSAGYVLTYLGLAAQASGELVLAQKYVKQGITILGEMSKGNYYLWSLYYLSLLEMAEGRFDQAEAINERILSLAREGNFEAKIAAVFFNRTRLARLSKDLKTAQKWAEEAVQYSSFHLIPWGFNATEFVLLQIKQSNLAEAGRQWREVLKAMQGRQKWASLIDTLALLAVRQKRYELAARLFGSRWCRGYAYFLSPIERASREADCTAVREALGEARFEALYEEGKSITFEQFIELADEVLEV